MGEQDNGLTLQGLAKRLEALERETKGSTFSQNSSLTVQGLAQAILATRSSYIRRLLLVLILLVFG